MQVVVSTAPIGRAAFVRTETERPSGSENSSVAGNSASSPDVPGISSGAALSYITSSTKLSGAEKAGFIRQLAQGGDSTVGSVLANVQTAEDATGDTSPAAPLEQAVDKKTQRSAFKVRAEQVLSAALGLDITA